MNEQDLKVSFPIQLKLDNLNVVMIGGGKIALRKCQQFLLFNQKVTIIAKSFHETFYTLNNVILIKDSYHEKYLNEAHLVVAATDDRQVNQLIGEFCQKHQKLVNVVDNQALSNFMMPAIVKRGDLLLTVSTNGSSPTLAKKIKKELEVTYGNYDETYLHLLKLARQKVLQSDLAAEKRQKILKELIDLSDEELEEFLLKSKLF